ncbi:heterokaryon incompatibility protein-domain-containing protein [Daedaleopsis nitida]|nr:heterokaryon incompatibility protein-domain-containing protein [Daedaleopsis nitida]
MCWTVPSPGLPLESLARLRRSQGSRFYRFAMRLLNTRTGQFHWFDNPHEVQYATLSHVWSQDGEQSFQELLAIQQQDKIARRAEPTRPLDAVLLMASPKIREACALAFADGFHYIWIDSCCIDKSSSAELSEAINSMYTWYGSSTMCYAFLHDVDGNEDPYIDRSTFRESRWFRRGWTLQELIAPSTVIFVSSSWRALGTKATFSGLIEEITSVDEGILLQSIPLGAVSVARRMSWASGRVTTRKEDEAYCLMGIFDVHIPVLYGEGVRAFIRLQEEILKRVSDQSIFVWRRAGAGWDQSDIEDRYFAEYGIHPHYDVLLSPTPTLFSDSSNVQAISSQLLAHRLRLPIFHPTDVVTHSGLRTSFPLVTLRPRLSLAILACEDGSGRLLALVLRRSRHGVYSVGATVCQVNEQLVWNVDIVTRHEYHTLFTLSLP